MCVWSLPTALCDFRIKCKDVPWRQQSSCDSKDIHQNMIRNALSKIRKLIIIASTCGMAYGHAAASRSLIWAAIGIRHTFYMYDVPRDRYKMYRINVEFIKCAVCCMHVRSNAEWIDLQIYRAYGWVYECVECVVCRCMWPMLAPVLACIWHCIWSDGMTVKKHNERNITNNFNMESVVGVAA